VRKTHPTFKETEVLDMTGKSSGFSKRLRTLLLFDVKDHQKAQNKHYFLFRLSIKTQCTFFYNRSILIHFLYLYQIGVLSIIFPLP